MSDTTNTERSAFTIIKTAPGNVMLRLAAVDNPGFSRLVYLTNRAPRQVLPVNFALDVFADPGNFATYKQGLFTFDDNDAIKQIAVEHSYYFDSDYEQFIPAKINQEDEINNIIKKGNRTAILNACQKYGGEMVKQVAITHVTEYTMAVVKMCEELWKIQLTEMDA